MTNGSQKMWNKLQGPHKTAIVVLALTVLWMASGLFKSSEPQVQNVNAEKITQIPKVRVLTSVGQLHTQTIGVMGRVQADQAVTVRAQVLGHVLDVVATKGQQVEAGDVILHIDPEDRKGLLAESVARMKQREIAYDAARKLRKGGYSSQLTVATSKADLAAVRAQVTRMKRNLANTTVRAPMAGIIDTLPVKAGDYFDKTGGIVGRVVNLSKMIALGQVAERDIGDVALGKIATVRLPGGREYAGEVTYVGSSSSALTRTFPVEVTLNVTEGAVREGVTAEIKLPMKTVFSHLISPALLTLDSDGKVGVKIVDENNVVQFRRVRVVSDSQSGMWLAGLPPKIRIISVGQEFVSVGQTVEAIDGVLKSMIPAPKSGS